MSVINSGAVISRAMNFVKRTGDTMSGSLILENDIATQGEETGGTVRNLIKINASDQVEIGNSTNENRMLNNVRFSNGVGVTGNQADASVRFLIRMNASDQLVLGSSTNINIASNDIEITDDTKGIILRSPDATRWRVQVDNDGALTTTEL